MNTYKLILKGILLYTTIIFTALFVSRLMFDFDTDVLHATKVSIGWRVK